MTLNTGALADMKAGRKAKPAKAEWKPLDLATLRPGIWFGCDQSYTACGIIGIHVVPGRPVSIITSMKLVTVPGPVGGWEDYYHRTAQLESRVAEWAAGVKEHVFGDVYYAHEAPPVGGGRLMRPEVSLLCGYGFRRAIQTTTRWTMVPMVRRQDHASLICGQANAKKPVEHTALVSLLSQMQRGDNVTNEAQRDALCVALTAAHRGP